MPVPIFAAQDLTPEARADAMLEINAGLVADWLTAFLKDEVARQRKTKDVVLGLSGGVDSAVVAALAARAFGPQHVFAYRLPYRLSSQDSLDHAGLVADQLGIHCRTIDISGMVDGYCSQAEPDMDGTRRGNVCARARMTILFDQSAKLRALPLGTGNKTERLVGYYTWHGDDAPPINPLGDLFKKQVWKLAHYLGIPDAIVNKPPTADLVKGQTDEGDLGISYEDADRILVMLTQGYDRGQLIDQGFDPGKVDLVVAKVDGTHWKRKPATVAMLSTSSIGDYYLRPVDYVRARTL